MSNIIAYNSENEISAVDKMLSQLWGNSVILYHDGESPISLNEKAEASKYITPISYKDVDDLNTIAKRVIEEFGKQIHTMVIFASQLAIKYPRVDNVKMQRVIKYVGDLYDNTIVMTYSYYEVSSWQGAHWIIPNCANLPSKEVTLLVS